MANGLNKFLHGTVWDGIPGELALIISSDEHNMRSPEVNYVSIVGNGNDNLVSLDNIRCDQIYTVEKQAFSTFRVAASCAAQERSCRAKQLRVKLQNLRVRVLGIVATDTTLKKALDAGV